MGDLGMLAAGTTALVLAACADTSVSLRRSHRLSQVTSASKPSATAAQPSQLARRLAAFAGANDELA